MRIFIDCEWNDFGGDLISIALVADDGKEFYEVLICDRPSPWVAKNVMPVLGKNPTGYKIVQEKLQQFLMDYPKVHIVADWPEDIERFCAMLITGPGERLCTPPLTMEIVRIDSISAIPHNALEDARALKCAYAAIAAQVREASKQ